MAETRQLTDVLLAERQQHISGGIYHRLQIDFAYNSNHIEGSRLTHDQTRYLFETHTVGIEPANVNDIFEAANHFRCFDHVLDTLSAPITEALCKNLHATLKSGVWHEDLEEVVIGDYKKYPNEVGGIETAPPEEVPARMQALLKAFQKPLCFYELLEFHVRFEQIHPFFDGNGRVGRLLLFKQCLMNGFVPFLVDDKNKLFYYRGLREWHNQPGYLIDTALFLQDHMKELLDKFRIGYDRTDRRARDVIAEYQEQQNT